MKYQMDGAGPMKRRPHNTQHLSWKYDFGTDIAQQTLAKCNRQVISSGFKFFLPFL